MKTKMGEIIALIKMVAAKKFLRLFGGDQTEIFCFNKFMLKKVFNLKVFLCPPKCILNTTLIANLIKIMQGENGSLLASHEYKSQTNSPTTSNHLSRYDE